MWEIWSKAALPYKDIPTQRVWSALADGLRLPRPQDCTDELHDIMMQCWEALPKNRPDFEDLTIHLRNLQAESAPANQAHLQILANVTSHSYTVLARNLTAPTLTAQTQASDANPSRAHKDDTSSLSVDDPTPETPLPTPFIASRSFVPMLEAEGGDLPPIADDVEDDVAYQFGILPSARASKYSLLFQEPMLASIRETDV